MCIRDSLDIIGRSFRAVTETFLVLESPERRLGLITNESNTKYMVTGQEAREGEHVQIVICSFEKVNNFVYLGCQVNSDGETTEEIKRRITSDNRCFFGLRPLFQSRTITRSIKLLLYKN